VEREEKIELAELLTHRMRSEWHVRRDRRIAAEMQLGMWESGSFTGRGVAELVEKARHGKPITQDEWIVLHGGFRNAEEIKRHCERVQRNCDEAYAKMVREEKSLGRWPLAPGDAPSWMKSPGRIIQEALNWNPASRSEET
jgi:hypothetical protein